MTWEKIVVQRDMITGYEYMSFSLAVGLLQNNECYGRMLKLGRTCCKQEGLLSIAGSWVCWCLNILQHCELFSMTNIWTSILPSSPRTRYAFKLLNHHFLSQLPLLLLWACLSLATSLGSFLIPTISPMRRCSLVSWCATHQARFLRLRSDIGHND